MLRLVDILPRLHAGRLRPRLPEPRHDGRAIALLAGLTAALAVLLTVAISVSSEARFAAYAPAGSVALETTAGLASALAAYLALGRFRLTGSVTDFTLIAALGLLALTTVLFFTGPALTGRVSQDFSVWGRALGQLLAGAAFCAAAFVAPDPVREHRGRILALIGGYTIAAVGGLATLVVVGPQLDLPDELPSESLSRPLVVGPPALLLLHVASAFLFAAAAVGFVRRASERGDGLTVALALGCPLAAAAAVHNFLFPSPYASYVFAGDLLRLSFYVLVLAGALRQIAVYQRAAERQGMSRERRRVAQDLHDGPVQDLALVQMHLSRLVSGTSDPALREVDAATARALREWRAAVSELAALDDRPLAEVLREAADAAVRRSGIALSTDIDEDIAAPPSVRRQLLYVLREALSNVVRHARARRVHVAAHQRDALTLVVDDDGGGFDREGAREAEGLGLRGMAERAARVSGVCDVDTGETGTRVTFVVPERALREDPA